MDIEKIKLLHDYTKHVSTLSTAAILMLVTFYEKLPGFPIVYKSIIFPLIFFVMSILVATFTQKVVISSLSNNDEKYEGNTLEFTDKALIISWLLFVLGMIFLCVIGVIGFLSEPVPSP